MYAPPPFNIQDLSEVIDFLRGNPFGTLIQAGDSEPIATHLPFQVDEAKGELILTAHLSRNNPHSLLIRNGKTALVTFLGPHGYVSSSVYGHPNVPTWNYQSIHVYGTISVASKEQMEEHLRELVQNHEANRTHRIEIDKLPKELIESYMEEILAFKITSYRVEGAFKLSQNRNHADFDAILDDLSKDPRNEALIKSMRASRK